MKIESGIPIPKRNSHLQSEFVNTLAKMKPGDSFFTEKSSGYACTIAKRRGYKVIVRKVDGGTRVWKIS